MGSTGSRGIARVSENPGCQGLAAMVALRMEEQAFHQAVFGCPIPGEWGERTSALRWGNLFEGRLAEANAATLLAALDGQLGINPGSAIVRNLRLEVPGDNDAAVAERLCRTRQVIADLLAGSPTCDLLLQPPLELPIPNLPSTIIIPDGLVLDRGNGTLVPLEAKGYVVRNGVAEPGDRDDMRRQTGVRSTRCGPSSRDTPQHPASVRGPCSSSPLPLGSGHTLQFSRSWTRKSRPSPPPFAPSQTPRPASPFSSRAGPSPRPFSSFPSISKTPA